MKETNQSMVVASERMAMQPTIARQNERSIWLYNSPPATPSFADAGIRCWNTSSSRIRSSQRSACRLGHPLQPSGVDPKSLTTRANFTPLLQMPRWLRPQRDWLLQNKTHTFSKESTNIFLPTISVLPLCSQSVQQFQPLATRAKAWQAIPGVSTWVMTMVKQGYTLQLARRPLRFRCVLATTVRSENA